MSTSITPFQFAQIFTRAYMSMNYEKFVRTVLKAVPRENDVWQMEKFELFQAAGKALSRMSTEHIENVIINSIGADYGTTSNY